MGMPKSHQSIRGGKVPLSSSTPATEQRLEYEKKRWHLQTKLEKLRVEFRKLDINRPHSKQQIVIDRMKKQVVGRLDKFYAIWRHPEFIEDYKQYKKGERNFNQYIKEGKTETRKFKSLTKSQFGLGIKFYSKWGEDIWQIETVENFRKGGNLRVNPVNLNSVKIVTSIEKPPIRDFIAEDAEFTEIRSSKEEEIRWQKGEYLYLQVDLDETKENLIENFKGIIDRLQRRQGREGKTTENPWEVYDGVKAAKGFKNYWKQKHGPYFKWEGETQSRYMQAYRAYYKALQMINAVTPPGVPLPFPKAERERNWNPNS